MHERDKIVLNLVMSVKLDEYCLQALLVPFVKYVQVLLAVAVAVAERQWLLYETSSIVSGGKLWLQRVLL